MDIQLGKMQRITDLRSVWPHEALDFTKWLAEENNLSLLSEAIGVDIILEERESSVGNFNVDIFASENGTNRKIIIENQLEDTNHDHLGKLITYASGKDAEIIIWIVKRARDEHKQAIEWLNQHTDEKIGFFLVEIELWQIDNSLKAPKFNIVEKPNDWAKTMKTIENLSPTNKLQLEFWQCFTDEMKSRQEFTKNFSIRKALPHHWYDLGLGSSAYHLGLTINTQKNIITAEIYINDDNTIFDQLKLSAVQIQQILGSNNIEWKVANKARRIIISQPLNIRNQQDWVKAFDWFYDKSLKFKNVVKQFIDK